MQAKTFQDWMRLFYGGSLVYLGVYLHNPNHHEEGKDKYRPYLPLEDGSIAFESRERPELILVVTLLGMHQFSIKRVVIDNTQHKVLEESVLYDVDSAIDAILSYVNNIGGLNGITRKTWGPARCKI